MAQDGNDWISGGGDDDAIEGNGGTDRLRGDVTPAVDGTDGQPVVVAPAVASTLVQRDGAPAPDGEDDIVGGSNVSHRDADDDVAANGEDDFVLGDNGTLQRNIVAGAYVRHAGDGATHDRIMRRAIRLDVGAAVGLAVWGGDTLRGNAGADAMWGQDGNDKAYGGAGDDDLFGELGNDEMYGGLGEDAMIGDRGGVLDTSLGDAGALVHPAALHVRLERAAVPHLHRVPPRHATTVESTSPRRSPARSAVRSAAPRRR